MQKPVALNKESDAPEHQALIVRRSSQREERCLDSISSFLDNMSTPMREALLSSAVPVTVLTMARGWPKSFSDIVMPTMAVGAFFNVLGFLDGLNETYKFNDFPTARRWYRAAIAGLNSFCFIEQFLIAIIIDIVAANGRQFDVGFGEFLGISAAPAVFGLVTFLTHGFDIQYPDRLNSLSSVLKHLGLSSLRLTTNAGTAHSLIQYLENLAGSKTTPTEQLLRYSLAIMPPLAAEGMMLVKGAVPARFVPKCVSNMSPQFGHYLGQSPVILFSLLTAVTYAVFNLMTLVNYASQFDVAGLIAYGLFWASLLLVQGYLLTSHGLPDRRVVEIASDQHLSAVINYEAVDHEHDIETADPARAVDGTSHTSVIGTSGSGSDDSDAQRMSVLGFHSVRRGLKLEGPSHDHLDSMLSLGNIQEGSETFGL